MSNHIINRPEFAEMTPAQLAAHLAESVSRTGDTSLWDYARVADTYGEMVAEGIAAAMAAAGLVTGVSAFASRGFNLSLEKVQSQLTAIAAAVPQLADACNDLKSRGRPTQTRWASHGGSGDVPTAEQVESYRMQRTLHAKAKQFFVAVNDPYQSGTLTQAAFDAALATLME